MAKELNNENATVNEAVNDKVMDQNETKADEVKKSEPWRLGPISIERDSKVVKVFKLLGIGTAITVLTTLGVKVGGSIASAKKDTIISNQAAEISRLNALIETAEPVVEAATEIATEAAEVVPEVISEVVSEE